MPSRNPLWPMKHVVSPLLAVLLLSFCLLEGTFAREENESTAQNERPNILFCIADDASYPHMGAYGCEWVVTPGFDRVAEDGLLFTRAYTPNAKCSPSRSCILTGRNTWQLEEACNHIPFYPSKFLSYAEVLNENGYFVGKTGKGWAPGVAIDAEGNRRQMTGHPFDSKQAPAPARGISGNDYTANFEDFLDARPEDEPFCFWYGGFEPHRGYEYGSGVAKGGKDIDQIAEVFPFWPDNEVVRNDILDYAFEIEHFDQHLVRMLDMLKERGELNNTIVVVTADNGMPFPRIKGQEYELSNHLPLAIMWPEGITAPGRTINDFVNFIDFAPTFLELADVDWDESGMQPTPGISLTDIFASDQEGIVNPSRDHVLIGKERHDIGRPNDWGYPIRGIVNGDYLYIRNFEPTRWPAGNPETGYLNTDGSPTKTEILTDRREAGQSVHWDLSFGKRPEEEMFNIVVDPCCIDDLLASNDLSEEMTDLRDTLRDQLLEELTAQEDPRALGRGEIFEAFPYADVGQQNFYEKYMRGEPLKAGWVSPSDFESEPLDK
jgi:N-sulfoglucosamine sulfohydrolase